MVYIKLQVYSDYFVKLIDEIEISDKDFQLYTDSCGFVFYTKDSMSQTFFELFAKLGKYVASCDAYSFKLFDSKNILIKEIIGSKMIFRAEKKMNFLLIREVNSTDTYSHVHSLLPKDFFIENDENSYFHVKIIINGTEIGFDCDAFKIGKIKEISEFTCQKNFLNELNYYHNEKEFISKIFENQENYISEYKIYVNDYELLNLVADGISFINFFLYAIEDRPEEQVEILAFKNRKTL